MPNTVVVSEMFYSIQGEGYSTGIPAIFLRTTSCNLTCPGFKSGGCDTEAVWRSGTQKSFNEIYEEWVQQGWFSKLFKEPRAHLIFTGGEPLLREDSLIEFVQFLLERADDHDVDDWFTLEWETNGTIIPTAHNRLSTRVTQQYNCSPKLTSAGNEMSKAIVPEALKVFSKLSWNPRSRVRFGTFKFVIQAETARSDLKEIFGMVETYKINPDRVYLMPEGADQKALAKSYPIVAEICKQTGFKFSPRLHVNIYNQATGV